MLHLLNRLPNFIKHNMDVPVLERTFIDDIKRLIEDARLNTYAAINAVMLETYWNIGKRIVEPEVQALPELAQMPLSSSRSSRAKAVQNTGRSC